MRAPGAIAGQRAPKRLATGLVRTTCWTVSVFWLIVWLAAADS